MNWRYAILALVLQLSAIAGGVSASSLSSSPTHSVGVFDSLDTSGHTRLKVFAGLYGAYLGIAVPIAVQANHVTFFALGLTTGPGIGLMSASGYSKTHSFSEGDAIALSSLTWFGALQGHLWGASADLDEGSSEVGFGVLGSLAGFVAGLSTTGAHDFTAGQAAALGAGNWWGTALGYEFASAREEAADLDRIRGAAMGGAVGVAVGALAGRGCTHNNIRYLHIGGTLGWLYSIGLVVLQEPDRTGESVTQIAGIGTGITAGLLASKFRPWRSRPGLDLDHSGRMRAQVFSMAYGGYLATVIPLASGVDWWNEDTKQTFALAYMHAPPGLLLGTTFFTRNASVSKADALTASGLTWFGASQGALWAASHTDAKTRDVAVASAAGSAAGLVAGVVVARHDLTDAQAAMLGAGNWWGSVLGLLVGDVAHGEDVEGESVAAAVAIGGIAGVAVGPPLGKHMSLSNVRTMHIGGLAGFLFGAGVLLGGENVDFRTANAVMAITTIGGLAMGAGMAGGMNAGRANYHLELKPLIARRPGLSGEPHTVIGLTFSR